MTSTPLQDTNNPRQFDALTGFRCLAACMVFVYHNRKYWRNFLPHELLRLINECNLGVSLFFVLSGFLIAYTYGDKPLDSVRSYYRYILLRMARILPLYWLVLTSYYLDNGYGQMRFTWLTYSLAHAFSDKHNLDGIAQAWSLNVEMVFYFLAPFLCLLQRKHILALAGFLLGFFLLTWLTGWCWYQFNGNPQYFFYPLHFLLDASFAGRSTEFLAGMLLAGSFRKNEDGFLRFIPNQTLVGFMGIVCSIYLIGFFEPTIYGQGTQHPAGRLIALAVLPFFTMTALSGLIREKTMASRFLASPPLVLFGKASFAFYLVHISYVNLKVKDYILLPDRNFTLLWGISIVLYLFFEKPLYQACRTFLKRSANN